MSQLMLVTIVNAYRQPIFFIMFTLSGRRKLSFAKLQIAAIKTTMEGYNQLLQAFITF